MSQRSMKQSSPRAQLAAARIILRAQQDHHERITAEAEQRIIDAAGGSKHLGANTEDCARAVTIALANDATYTESLMWVRNAQAEVDRLQAEVDDLIDQGRKLDRASRDRASRDRASAAIEQLALLSHERMPLSLAADLTHAA